jgi:nitrite reductase/ring-hydroxylating ferredoxin subunit
MGLVALEKLERLSWLDPLGERLQRLVSAALRPRMLRDALHGVWLGHPLHAALVQAPVGAWLSAAALDAVPGQRRAATALVAAGTVAAVPTAVAGWNDWASLAPEQRRVGLVHAAANATAVSLYVGSLVARLRGRYALGRTLSYTALGVAGAGAYLGGHLSFRQAAGVSHAAPWLRLVSEGWHDLGAAADFAADTMTARTIGEVPVLVYRDGDRFSVLLERCSHQAGPLAEGSKVEIGGAACVVCPWHGSTFRLADGSVVRGPAAVNQPALQVRVVDGRVEAGVPGAATPDRRPALTG